MQTPQVKKFNIEKVKQQLSNLTDYDLHQLLLAIYQEQDRRDKEFGTPTGNLERRKIVEMMKMMEGDSIQ